MPRVKLKEKRYILLDTNIISSFSNEELGKKIITVLTEAVQLGFGIAISDITYFEIINGTSVETEERMMSTLSGIERFYVMKDILVGAAHLGALYKDENLRLDQFGTCDQIIASTAILHNCIIFTKNGRDFPMPFFKELDRRMIEYKTNKSQDSCVPVYFLEAQIDYISRCYADKVGQHKQKQGKRLKKATTKKARVN